MVSLGEIWPSLQSPTPLTITGLYPTLPHFPIYVIPTPETRVRVPQL